MLFYLIEKKFNGVQQGKNRDPVFAVVSIFLGMRPLYFDLFIKITTVYTTAEYL